MYNSIIITGEKTMKAYYLSLFLLCFSLLVESAEERKSAEDIAINEICIKQETKGYPKWVELICLSKEKINLKGWSLNDSSDCFFKFKDDLYLEPQQLLMICFYEGNDPSQKSPTFSKNISKDVKHVINVYNCNEHSNCLNLLSVLMCLPCTYILEKIMPYFGPTNLHPYRLHKHTTF